MDSIKVSVAKNEVKKPAPKKETVAAKERSEAPKKNGSGGMIGKLFSAIIVTALIIGGASYIWSSSITKEQVDKARGELTNIKSEMESKITDLQNKVVQVETENSDLKTNNEQLKGLADLLGQAKREFDSPELGIKFEYPASYGEVKWTIEKGEAGKIFSASFSNNSQLVFGGITKDYQAGNTGTYTATQGWQKKSGKYFFIPADGSKPENFPITPLKVVKIDNNEILFLDNNSFATGTPFSVGENNLGALANLTGKEFTGLAILNKDIQAVTQADFEKIINSIEIR